jgi:hypothetical protein
MFSQVLLKTILLAKFLDSKLFLNTLRRSKVLVLRLYLNHSLQKYSKSTINIKAVGQKELAGLCDKYGSDKGSLKKLNHNYPWQPHSYTDIYEFMFADKRFKTRKIFECGVGTSNLDFAANMGPFGKAGASLRVWQDYFPNALIYGGDIDSSVLFNEGRIKTYYLDQTDPNSFATFFNLASEGEFDLMIDDGLHTFEAGWTLFNNSHHFLKQGGMWIIEDVRPSAMKKFLELDFSSMGFMVYPITFRGDNGALDLSALLVLIKA